MVKVAVKWRLYSPYRVNFSRSVIYSHHEMVVVELDAMYRVRKIMPILASNVPQSVVSLGDMISSKDRFFCYCTR